MELRPEDIKEILRVFAESDLEELHLDVGGTRLDLSKTGSRTPGGAAPEAPESGRGAGEGSSRDAPSAGAPPAPEPVSPAPPTEDRAEGPATSPADRAATDGLVELRAPLLGVFYRRPAPDKPPFVEVGSEVEPDDPVCIIDVMKLFTQVPAGVAGTIVEVLAEDGKLIEHGQVLMTIRPR